MSVQPIQNSKSEQQVLPPLDQQISYDEILDITNSALRKSLEFLQEDKITFPIDVYKIATNLKIGVYGGDINQGITEQDPNWVSGAIQKKANELYPSILLEERDPEPRKLFTLAHELGHYLQWKGDFSDEQLLGLCFENARHPNDGDSTPKEYFANTFAHMLLMPGFEFVRCISSGMEVKQMMEHFGVSEATIKRRMSYLDIASQTFTQSVA